MNAGKVSRTPAALGLPDDPLELHAQLAAKGLRAPGRVSKLAQRVADARARFEDAEADLARAANRWNKQRLALRRLERELERAFAEADVAELDIRCGADALEGGGRS